MRNSRLLNRGLTNIALFVFVLILCFILFEIFLRIFYPMTLEDTIFNPHLRYEKIPNWEGHLRNPQFVHTEYLIKTKYNSLGLNDYEINFSSLRKNYVILAIGDSNVYGQGVQKEDSFPKVIEKELADQNVKVINAGTLSYSLDTYLNYIKYNSDMFSPDMIIIGVAGNDINDQNLYELTNGKLIEKPLANPSLTMNIRRFLLRHSHAYSFLLRGIDQTIIGDFLREKGIFEKRSLPLDLFDSKDYKKNLAKSEKIIEQIKIEAEKRNQKLLFVILPLRDQVDDDYFNKTYGSTLKKEVRFRFQEDLSGIFKKNNLSYLDPLGTYRKLNKGNSFYYNIDGHFNKDGYYLMGSLIASKIREVEKMR